MTIAVIGAGAIGGVVAAYLTKAGCDVTLIAKPDQCAVIKEKGLTIDGVRGRENFRLNVRPKLNALSKIFAVSCTVGSDNEKGLPSIQSPSKLNMISPGLTYVAPNITIEDICLDLS